MGPHTIYHLSLDVNCTFALAARIRRSKIENTKLMSIKAKHTRRQMNDVVKAVHGALVIVSFVCRKHQRKHLNRWSEKLPWLYCARSRYSSCLYSGDFHLLLFFFHFVKASRERFVSLFGGWAVKGSLVGFSSIDIQLREFAFHRVQNPEKNDDDDDYYCIIIVKRTHAISKRLQIIRICMYAHYEERY